MTKNKIGVILWGLGNIGSAAARMLLGNKGVEIVGAIANREEKAGRDLGQVLGLGRNLGVKVSNDADEVLSQTSADIAILSTNSLVSEVYPAVKKLVSYQVDVVTCAERWAQPYVTEPRLATEIDKLAKENGVSVLSTGLSPGFAAEFLMFSLTGMCSEIRSVKRVATTIVPYLKGIPRALRQFGFTAKSSEEFRSQVKDGIILGHRGGTESLISVAQAFGWKLDEVKQSIEPVMRDGQIVASRTIDSGIMGGKEVLGLDLTCALEPSPEIKESFASFIIDGTPSFTATIKPYNFASIGTPAVLVNTLPHVINARPGIIYVWELPVPSAIVQDMRLYLK